MARVRDRVALLESPEEADSTNGKAELINWVTASSHIADGLREYPNLLGKILGRFPPSPVEGEPLLLTVWTEDNGFRIPSGKMLARSRELAKRGLGESLHPLAGV
jgi:hypothetical protein